MPQKTLWEKATGLRKLILRTGRYGGRGYDRACVAEEVACFRHLGLVRLQVCSAHYPPSSWVHLGSATLGSSSTSDLGAAEAGMIEPVLEKAPDLEMKLDRAAIPSTVPRIVDKAMDREAFLEMPPPPGVVRTSGTL